MSPGMSHLVIVILAVPSVSLLLGCLCFYLLVSVVLPFGDFRPTYLDIGSLCFHVFLGSNNTMQVLYFGFLGGGLRTQSVL